MTTLYLVPTPLGDLSEADDITLRALRILREVSAIATPDPQTTRRLLDHHTIATPLIAYDVSLDALSRGDVALVAALGTPGIGDAAHEIVREAIARGIRIEPLPGASAIITALVLSGLPTNAFAYFGTLPDDLSAYTFERDTMIFTTYAVLPALDRLLAALGDRRVNVSTRLTQPDELVFRGTAREALAYFRDLWAGEFVLVVEGAPEQIEEAWDEARVRAALRGRMADGEPLKQAAKAIAAAAGWDRRAVYALGVDEKRNTP